MIAAPEPLEFIPRGREAAVEHIDPSNVQKPLQFTTENILLNRLKTCTITNSEFWCIYEDADDKRNANNTSASSSVSKPGNEHELYVKGCVAVWTKGIREASTIKRKPPVLCFTCDTPIRFAFFCPANFFTCPNLDKREQEEQLFDCNRPLKENIGVCVIDSMSMRVYSPCGKDFRTSFPFAITNAWQFKDGMLFERNASTTTLDNNHTVDMPRLYSLSHQMHDIFPVLLRTLNGNVSLITDADIKIAFVVPEKDFVMIHDGKKGKHILCKLRKATLEEKQKVGVVEENDIFSSDFNVSNMDLCASNSVRFDGSGLSMRQKNRSSLDASSLHATKMLNITPTHAQSLRARLSTSFDKSQLQSPYDRHQSPRDAQLSFREKEVRIGDARPARPIVPELCLEIIWIESIGSRDFPEMAACGFLHCDFIDQQYICYLLKRTGALFMHRLEKSNTSDKPIKGTSSSIPAKDAVSIKSLKMIAIIAPCGMLNLYSGPTFVGKVDVGIATIKQPQISYPIPSTSKAMLPPSCTAGIRRSSLLPTLHSAETSFDEEVHLLSPVYPLQHPPSGRGGANGCCNLRDVCGNRLTLQYTEDVMFRITLPLISECPLVTKCLVALRYMLRKDLAIAVTAKWYALRNTRGSLDISYENEWSTFYNYMLNLMGRTYIVPRAFPAMPSKSNADEAKRARRTNEAVGTDDDFKFLKSYVNKTDVNASDSQHESRAHKQIDMSSILAPYMPIIFFSFHLIYEEMKLDESQKTLRSMLAELLFQLTIDLHLNNYSLHYFTDCPELVYMYRKGPIAEIDQSLLNDAHLLTAKMPNIFQAIEELYSNKIYSPYPFIPNVNPVCKSILDLVTLKVGTGTIESAYRFSAITTNNRRPLIEPKALTEKEKHAKALQHILDMNMDRKDLLRFAPAIHYIIVEILEYCRVNIPESIPPRAYELIIRPELYSNTACGAAKGTSLPKSATFKNENSLTPRNQMLTDNLHASTYDGMTLINTKLFRLRFPKDLRVDEVRRMLASSQPAVIDITQKIGTSDHKFIEEKERFLLSVCSRTCALPFGRGMFTMQTCKPSATESFGIPKLCLTGREKEKGCNIEMTTIDVPATLNNWPLFHNGVAAGLQITGDKKNIDSAWIVYNKLKSQQNGATIEHAGFLLGLGLNGHLKILTSISLYDYLVKSDEMTNLSILIGIAAANRGTMDLATTKALSIHIEALLPPTALELDVSQNVQIAAIMGIGLLYQGTAKRHIAEVMAQEIGRPPGPEMENCVERESYALTAGLALGLVTLGRGENSPGLADLKLPDMLHRYMVGGRRDALIGAQREKYRFQSFQVHEGDIINTDVTAPGATLALGLMFMGTGSKSVAAWMDPPDTQALLETVRPDLLMLRVIARSLIMWHRVRPAFDWITVQYPKWIRVNVNAFPSDSKVDPESFGQAYCNIMAGAAFCIGLKYAGTSDPRAIMVLTDVFTRFLSFTNQATMKRAGKPTAENCLMLTLLALSMVTAGSGDLRVIRRCRMLRTRVGPKFPHVTYGSHMAIHMALGFQFLGAGRFTLSRSPQAVAALVCALFPKFPIHTNDNRYHLQAFRHLYVLAVEPRLLLPRDIDTGALCLCNVEYKTIKNKVMKTMAPCILPALDEITELYIKDDNYWSIEFTKANNWADLERIIRKGLCMDIKQRAGFVSHVDDPTNSRCLFAHTISTEQFMCWRTHPLNLFSFTNSAKVQNFINRFMTSDNELGENSSFLQLMMLQFYHSLTRDSMHALYIYIDLLISYYHMVEAPEYYDISQLKLMQIIFRDSLLLCDEYMLGLFKRVELVIEKKLHENAEHLQRILFEPSIAFLANIKNRRVLRNVAAVIQYLDLPLNVISQFNIGEDQTRMNYLRLLVEMGRLGYNGHMAVMITKILNAPIS